MKKIPDRELKRHGEDRHKRSSTLYKYLAFNMEGLRAQGYGARNGPAWAMLVDQAIRDGFTRVDGGSLSVDVVRKVFARADATLAAEERQRRTGMAASKKPTRMPAGWQPPIVGRAAPTLSHSTKPASLVAQTTTGTEPGTSDPYSPERLKAGFLETVAKRSGR